MIIGSFTLNAARDEYVGEIVTLALRRRIVLRPQNKVTTLDPDYRVFAESGDAPMEFGSAWKRSEKGREFIAVTIDDPSLPAVLKAALYADEERGTATLVWHRPKRGKPD